MPLFVCSISSLFYTNFDRSTLIFFNKPNVIFISIYAVDAPDKMSIFVCSRSISIFKLSYKSNFALANRSKALFSRAHYYNFTSQHLIAKFPQKWQPFLKLMRADKPIG